MHLSVHGAKFMCLNVLIEVHGVPKEYAKKLEFPIFCYCERRVLEYSWLPVKWIWSEQEYFLLTVSQSEVQAEFLWVCVFTNNQKYNLYLSSLDRSRLT